MLPAAAPVLALLVAAAAVHGGAPLLVPAAQLACAAVLAAAVALVPGRGHGRGHGRGRAARPVRLAVLVVVALFGLSSTVAVVAPASHLDRWVVLAGQAVGCGALVPVVARHRRAVGASASARSSWADAALAVVGASVGVALVARAAWVVGVGTGWTLTLAGDLVILAFVVWFRLTRVDLVVAVRLVLHAGALFAVHDVLLCFGAPASPVLAVAAQGTGVLVAATFTAAALHPSLDDLAPGAVSTAMRRGSARLQVVLPFAAVPPLAGAVGGLAPAVALPGWSLQLSGTALAVLALLRAIGLLRSAEEAAERDPLTGRLGRSGLMRHLQGRALEGRPAWVCFIDLDDFKLVNDQHGHEAGDALLTGVVDRLAAALPLRATVARLGGDELVVVHDAAAAEDVATRVLAAFAEPFVLPGAGVGVAVRASVGVARLAPGATADSALACADIAMYTAKRRGRGQWALYEPAMREEVMGAALLQGQLRSLLQAGSGDGADDVGQLVVHYQPVVDLAAGLPSGVEALVRWLHPQRGLLGPDRFVPLAAQAGLGAELDRWVLHRALHQAATWRAAGLVGLHRVGVNLGAASVRSATLADDVLGALRASGAPAGLLLLEITEHDELDADPAAAGRLVALRRAGVSIALDDFGTGYASLGYLRRWPVDVVKLDRSLLPGALEGGDPSAVDDPAALLAAVVDLVTAMGRQVVAEGVETPDDERAVRAAGVRYAQGWLHARAMPAEDLAAWWSARCAGTPAARAIGATR